MNQYTAQVTRIIDGDTFEAIVNLGFGVCQKFKIRLAGIDTPELKTLKGKIAKEYVSNLLENKTVFIYDNGIDKYGRALAKVTIEGQDLTELLIENHIGTEYHGSKKFTLFLAYSET